MVTKYDLFEIIYKADKPLKPIEVARILKKNSSEYKNIHRILNNLEKEKLTKKTSQGFEINKSEKTKLLSELIYYCVKNNINYNYLLDKNLAVFIYKALEKEEFQQKDIKINSKTFKKYIDILNKYNLILIISKKPLKARIFYNTLINNLLIYFNFKKVPIREKTINYLKEIEKELSLYKKLRKNNEKEYKKIVDEFEISFIQHSLSLEGNPITLPDTIKILKHKIIPKDLRSIDVEEIKNYQNAILKMIKNTENKKPLTLQLILDYHKLSMAHHPRIAGKIRNLGVFIKGNLNFKVSDVENIEKKLINLLEKYNNFIKKKKISIQEILSFASYFHSEFQHIHPFEDGNSRTTRLITFHLLQSKGIPILDIPLGLLDEYMDNTKGSKERDDKRLFEHIQKIILFNLKKINQRLSL